MAFLIFGPIEALKFYLRLSDSVMEACKTWIGKEIVSISAAQMQKDWSANEMFLSSELGLMLYPQSIAVRVWQEEIAMEDLPISFALRTDNEPPKHHAVVFQFNKPFVIRKIEIWAEKTRDSSGVRDKTQLTENTLIFIAETGERWMLLPDHPGPGFLLAWGEKEMNRILHSGWYVLKHILD
ncbi:MAG: hypothetical protein RIT07_1785 [Bacteroidota bacterium]